MEVKAKELRIGNWINECEMSYLGTKVTIEHNDKIIQDAFDLQTIEETPELFKYIQLSPDWAIKLGFKKEGDYYVIDTPLLQIKLEFCDDDKIDVYIYQDGKPVFYCRWIEYVHTIQNLYFALTDTEL